jgi:MFS family permease
MMSQQEKKVAWLAGTSHLLTHGYMTLLPAVLVVMVNLEGLDFFSIGTIATVGYFLYGFGSIPAGIISDRIGARRMLRVGLYGMAFSSILVGLSANSWTFAVSYGLLGLSASIYHPSGLSLIAKHIEQKGRALGLHGIMGNVGLSMAPLFAGLMVMAFDTWRAAYIAFGLLGLCISFFILKTRVEGEENEPLDVVSPASGQSPSGYDSDTDTVDKIGEPKIIHIPAALLLLYIGCILFGFIYRGTITFMPALFQAEVYFIAISEEPAVLAGLITTMVLSAGMIGQWMGGYIYDRFKRPELSHVIIFIVLGAVLYCISRLTDSWLIVLAVFFSISLFVWQPLQNAMIAKYTSKRSHGKGYGVNFFLIMGVGSIATAIGGYVADTYGVDVAYFVFSIAAVAALCVSMAVLKFKKYSVRLNFLLEKE